jgi:hypothetical protein
MSSKTNSGLVNRKFKFELTRDSLCHISRADVVSSRELDVADGFENRAFPSGGIAAHDNLWNLENMIDIELSHFINYIQKSSVLIGLVGTQVRRNSKKRSTWSICRMRCLF